LNSSDYNLDWLSSVLQHINDANQYTIEKLSLIDTAISINLLHFLSDLHYGRINPRSVGFNFNIKRKPADFVPLILSAHQENQISSLLDKAEPKIAVYHTLKKALSDYRNMDTSVNSVPLKYRSSIKPKKHSYQVALIRRQLIHLNILDDIPGPLNNLYDSNLVKIIKTFQFHHGLTEDGVIGKKTIQALNVSFQTECNFPCVISCTVSI
jgi:murein L,D-transpeptidase YcbB/YkuD